MGIRWSAVWKALGRAPAPMAVSSSVLAAAVLYLVPPLLARLIRKITGIREGALPLGGRDFYAWWALANLQMLYCRLPFLEELLRLLPWGYSNWLRLWGAKIGRRVYWSAGTMILDRQFVAVGDDVVFGAGVKINPHVITPNADGQTELLLATVRIGDRAVVGGYSLLTSGTEIAADECCRAMLISSPFSKWSGGRRSDKHYRPPS